MTGVQTCALPISTPEQRIDIIGQNGNDGLHYGPDTHQPAPETHHPHPDTHQIGGEHYTQMSVQPWDVVATWPLEQQIGFYRGNALKYLMRMGSKDAAAQEIGKAKHYLEKLETIL